jgi:molybdate transport system substrate-binding protein
MMNERSSVAVVAAAFLSSLLVPPTGQAAEKTEVNAFMSIALQGAVEKLLPDYEKQSGQHVIPTYAASAALNQRLRDGATADLLISTSSGIDALIGEGKILAGSAVPIGSSGIGIAVRKGAPRPDISTPEAFKRTLLAAKAISYSNPVNGGASGVYFATLLERLGIADQIKPKAKFPPPNGRTASLLVSGDVDLAIQQTPELLAVEGAEVVGQLPGDLQLITTYVAGIPSGAKQVDGARKFVQFLQTPRARAMMKEKGLAAQQGK